MTKTQKFQKDDLVRIDKDLGSSMSHFTNDCDAIVIYTYAERYWGDDIDNYCLHLKGRGQVSWYCEHQLTLIEEGKLDLLETWEREMKEEADLKGSLDWIFENGESVLKSAHGASIAALAKCFGLTNLWGKRGEGITYYSNARTTLSLAQEFLKTGDKKGWIEFCKLTEKI